MQIAPATIPVELSGLTGQPKGIAVMLVDRQAVVFTDRSPGRWTADAVALTVLVLTLAAFAAAAITRRSDLTSGGWFLFADQGMNLLFTQQLLEGRSLYADIAYPYGPVSAYAYTAFAAILKPSVFSYHLYFAVTSIAAMIAAYALFRGVTSPPVALLVVVVAILPTMLVPGSLLGGSSNAPYITLERILLLGLALAWTPPGSRNPRRAIVLGTLLVAWQATKFGGAFFAGAAVVLLDLVGLHIDRWTRPAVVRWIQSSAITLVTFVAGEGVLIAGAYLTLPPAIAAEVVWPVHVLESYRMYPSSAAGLQFTDVRLVVGQYLTPLFGALLGAIFVVALAGKRGDALPNRDWRWLRLLLPPLFFLVGAVGYFRQTWHFEQAMWTLAIPVALVALVRQRSMRLAGLALTLPCFALVIKAMFVTRPDASLVNLALPNGERLKVRAEMRKQVTDIVAELRQATGDDSGRSRGVYVVPAGGGLNYFYGLAAPARQHWFLTAFVRPHDENRMRDLLSAGPSTFVIRRYGRGEPGAADPCAWIDPPIFSRSFCSALAPRLSVRTRMGNDLTLFDVRPVSAEETRFR